MSFTEKLKKSKYFPIIAVVLALLIWLGQTAYEYLQKEEQPVVESTCTVHFVDVGQGDCTLITCGGYSLLIDAGENGHESEVINYLRNHGIEKLDYVIGTHPHSDHIGGMADVIYEFPIGKMYMPKVAHNSKAFETMLDAIDEKGVDVYTAGAGV
ncbi:MAG: MBL fold metallo-hydrolase, partial [Clostridia bacterium]|nr:MBL fold metallo-hydrolase [Clostridia bacterium]